MSEVACYESLEVHYLNIVASVFTNLLFILDHKHADRTVMLH